MTPNPEIIVASISAIGLVLAALITGLFKLTSKKIQEIHLMINSRLTQMLEIVRVSSEAVGEKRELDRDKSEDDQKKKLTDPPKGL